MTLFHFLGCTKISFNYDDTKGLVSMHFLAALNIYFAGNSTLSKDVKSESQSFHNLNENINDLINTKKGPVISEIQNFNPPAIVGDEPTINNKIGSIIVKEILNDEKHPTDVDHDGDNGVSYILLAKVAEKLEPEIGNFGADLQELFQANIRSDCKPVFNK